MSAEERVGSVRMVVCKTCGAGRPIQRNPRTYRDAQVTAPSITEFLLARIAEDEAYLSNDLNSYDSPHTAKCNFPGDMTGWCDCGLRDKLLAECAAKRAIVEADKQYDGWEILEALATVYATHPDYQRKWAL